MTFEKIDELAKFLDKRLKVDAMTVMTPERRYDFARSQYGNHCLNITSSMAAEEEDGDDFGGGEGGGNGSGDEGAAAAIMPVTCAMPEADVSVEVGPSSNAKGKQPVDKERRPGVCLVTGDWWVNGVLVLWLEVTVLSQKTVEGRWHRDRTRRWMEGDPVLGLQWVLKGQS